GQACRQPIVVNEELGVLVRRATQRGSDSPNVSGTRLAQPSSRTTGQSSDVEANMDAIEMLVSDHQRVRKLFEAFENSDPGSAPSYGSTGRETATDRPEVAQLCAELEAHALVEERVFYPAVRALNDDALNRQVSDALEEHVTVNEAVASLRAMSGAFTDMAAR